ncbi:hypothetical protein FHX80_13296 [Streptomyces brevispora]|uniref:Uncharacterized protein n=1 Tax=Streptomyces brevispora TaxID=887462 RepID=A0A561TUU0_9ACTN|nr:hypothetical protein FHX80_13296 [Streptomyces brevispora]
MRDLAGFGTSTGSGTHPLDAALDQFMRETDASGGMVYLLPPGERVLRLAVLRGVPRQIAAHTSTRSGMQSPLGLRRRPRREWAGSGVTWGNPF